MNKSSFILAFFILVFTAAGNADQLPNIESRSLSAPEQNVSKAAYVQAKKESTYDSMQILQRLESMQQDVQDLRGLIEVQQHEIEHLNNKQRDLYLDLDRRLGQQKQHKNKDGHFSTDIIDIPAAKTLYKEAYQQLKQKHYTQAKSNFKTILKNYSADAYAANANYWLGEIYLLEGEDKLAWRAFKNVVDQFPKHNKASDSLLKLGLMSMDNGKFADAKTYFSILQQQFPNTTSAKLAEKQLRTLK